MYTTNKQPNIVVRHRSYGIQDLLRGGNSKINELMQTMKPEEVAISITGSNRFDSDVYLSLDLILEVC